MFSALSSNDSLRVIVFAIIFGAGMVMSERRSGTSIFSALRHIQAVCILIFDWFNLLVPFGIVALVAPQVALLGADVYTVLRAIRLCVCDHQRAAPDPAHWRDGDASATRPAEGCLRKCSNPWRSPLRRATL